jgi:type IV pilus assembly protein PilC
MPADRPDRSDLPVRDDRTARPDRGVRTDVAAPDRVTPPDRPRPGSAAGPGTTSDVRRGDPRSRWRARRGRVLDGLGEDARRPEGSSDVALPSLPGGAADHPPVRWSPDATELRLLSELVDGGLTVEQALAELGRAGRAGRRAAGLEWVHAQVRAGTTLPDALAAAGAPRHVVALLSGAELSGRTGPGLEAAAVLLERMAELRGTVRRSLAYPSIVLSVGLVVLLVVTTAVVPRLEATFADLGGELPYATRLVVAFSAAVRSPWTLTLSAGLVLLLLGRRALSLRPSRTGSGAGRATSGRKEGGVVRDAIRRVLRRRGPRDPGRDPGWSSEAARGRGMSRVSIWLSPRVPVVGPLRVAIDVAVATRVVATVAEQGVAVHVALDRAADGVSLAHVRRALRHAAEAMRAGTVGTGDDGLGVLLDPRELRMLDVGAGQGMLAAQWSRIAARRARQLEVRLAALGAAVEPLLVVVVGMVVGGAVLALYLPSFRVLELL